MDEVLLSEAERLLAEKTPFFNITLTRSWAPLTWKRTTSWLIVLAPDGSPVRSFSGPTLKTALTQALGYLDSLKEKSPESLDEYLEIPE